MTMGIETPQSSDTTPFVKRFFKIVVVGILCIFVSALFVPGPIQKSSYMGAEYCGSCHQQEYISWRDSAHSRAHDVLADADKSNLACLSCHATGVSDKSAPFFKGVQCESCHGPGQYYASVHIGKDAVLSKLLFMQKPDENSCMQCHSNTAGSWSAAHAMKQIDHWSANKNAYHKAEAPKKVE